MAGITLEQATVKVESYLTAIEAVLTGQKIRLNTGGIDREFTRADLSALESGLKMWEGRVARLSRPGGIRVREVIPK